MDDVVNPRYDPDRCNFLMHMLYQLFDGNADQLLAVLSEKIIDREIVLEKIPLIFETLFQTQDEQYQNIIFEIVDLHCVDQKQIEERYLVRLHLCITFS